MKIRIRQSYELLDKVNTKINRYKQRPIFDLIDFYHTRSEDGYIYLHVVVQGERDGAPINVYQVLGAIVTLEKINDLLYRYVDPEDEMYTSRTFEVEVIIGGVESKKKQTTVISSPTTYYLTSQIYPINFTDESNLSSSSITGRILTTNDLRLYQSIFEEGKLGISKLNGIFKQSLFVYLYKDDSINSQQKPNYESVELKLHKINGILRQLLIQNSVKAESINLRANKITGILRQLLIRYTYWAPEILKVNVNKIESSFISFPIYFESYISGNTSVYDPNDSDNGVTIIQKSITSGNKNDVNDKGIAYKSHNTSVLDFENGLTDRVNSGVTWSKEGTGDLTTINKLYGSNSFETKALGDSLYTNSNIITGGSTPFTIEFYLLLTSENINVLYNIPIFCSTIDNENYKAISRSIATAQVFTSGNTLNVSDGTIRSKSKFNLNEINKITMSYDGSAFRLFINDILEIIKGTLTGYFTKGTNPYYFLKELSGYTRNSFGLIDNINIHDGIATKVRDYDPYEENLIVDLAFDGENNSTNIVDNGTLKSNWTVNGNAKISTDQKFDGFSSLYIPDFTSNITSNINFNFSNNWTISFQFKSNIEPDSQVHTAFFKNTTDDFMFGVMNHGSHHEFQFIKNSVTYAFDYTTWFSNSSKVHNIAIIKNENIYSLYINNVFIENKNFNIGNNFSDNISIIISPVTGNGRSFIGYYKNFKIYKGVAVIPEDPTGKIQLDFDNNVIDKYGNSAWTNNGVTFDQVNSVKGYSAYFNGSSNLQLNNNSLLNFGNKNFNIEFDGNKLNNNQTYSSWLTPNGASYPSQWCELSSWNTNLQRFQNLAASAPELTGAVLNLNTWYKWQLTRNNGTVILKANDVVTGISNYTPSMNVNFNNGTGTNLIGTSSNAMNCYMDNFKSEKEAFTTEYNLNINAPLETSFNNLGTYLTNFGGSGSWSTVNGKNCIKFSGNQYLQLNNSSPLFDLGTDTDFYFELDVIQEGFKSADQKAFAINDSFLFTMSRGSISSKMSFNGQELEDIVFNQWYKLKVIRKNQILKVYVNTNEYTVPNISIMATRPLYLGSWWYNSSNDSLNGAIANFKFIKGYSELPIEYSTISKPVIDKPAVHLPLETNAINTGFTSLTINSVGSPTYTTIDGKKCIKFESGKYLTINSNNIFNLGTNSDFYIEMHIYPLTLLEAGTTSFNNTLIANTSGFSAEYRSFHLNGDGRLQFQKYHVKVFESTNSVTVNEWNSVIIKREKDILKLILNGIETIVNNTNIKLLDASWTSLGYTTFNNYFFNGYMSNFKMFVGTSEIPETYNDKAVLDLDFKPTRKSYLFKDNNNKCVIHPVNITQRDYQDSQYCCSFNGTNQYLQLGKNDLLNFGNDDFVMEFKFKPVNTSNWNVLIANGNTTSGDAAYCYIGVSPSNHGTPNQMYVNINSGAMLITYPQQIDTNSINTVIFYKEGNTYTLVVNGQAVSNTVTNIPNFDLNNNNNTIIGRTNHNSGSNNHWFTGEIYSIKVFRNTTDTSVLNLPILNTPSNVYLPLVKDSVDIRTGTTWSNTASVTYSTNGAYIDPNTNPTIRTVVENNLNYGTSDFTIGIESYKTQNYGEARLVASLASATSTPRTEIKQSATLGLTLSNYLSSSETMYKTGKSGDLLNNWYKSKFSKTNNTLFTYINDSLIDITSINNGVNFNLNANNGTILGGIGWLTNAAYKFGGYLKNFYSNSTANVDNVLPYLYMPYDTSLTDFGVNNLSITNSTTSASVLDTLNGVKCTRITTVSTNPYITMTLGSVFTIKAKIYIPTKASSGYHKPLFGTGYNSNIGFLLSQFTEPWSGNANPQLWLRTSGSNISFAINGLIGTWIDIIVTKTLTTLTLNVNGVDVGSMNNSNWNNSDFESSRTFYIGDAGTDWKESSTFYIKDFRFYKGLLGIPTNEVLSKKVLDLKFKKDDARVYPFKDESRRHIVSYNAMSKYNLVNIEETDCIQFNGVNQYLELGNTKLMNFGNEDFVIAFKIYIIPYLHTGSSQWQVILASGGTSPSSNVNYIAYDQTTKSLVIRATDNEVYRISNVLNEYAWNTVIITRTADKFNTIINNNTNNGVISSTANFNLNYNANTYIGIDKWNTSNEYLKGYLADLQIVKGSNDISLLDLNTTENITIVNPPKTIYYPAVMNELDAFNISWYQTNSSNLVRLKEFNKGENTALYFDGISGLISSNYCYSIGLNKFTFECSILISGTINVSYPVKIFMSHINVNSYINSFRYWLEVTSTGILRFTTNNGNSYYSTPANTIGYNQKYHIEVSRDENKILRVFVNGVSMVEGVCNDNIGSQTNDNITYQSYLSLILGKNADYYSGSTNYGNLVGMIENFHFIKGICKHTNNFTPSDPVIVLNPNKTLLNVTNSLGTNPSTIIDVGNNITYTNTGSTVEATPSNSSNIRNYSLRSQSTATRIVSSVSASTFNLTNENWTIDLVFIPSQTSAEAYLLDTRINSTIFRGIVVRQPETSPSSIRVEIGSTTASSYEISCTSANNSLVIGTRYHLKIVKCRERILIYLNGSEIGSYNWGIKEIGYTDRVILFNNDLFNKGFNGYLLQFRYIKKIATDTRSYTNITEELK